ncbi:nucleotide binding protein PINc [Helicobacter cetorum MIT 00-7128]|uniref:Nucleotide binding protein PINc n=2 Tax=Helicobacter cetorum TaxID=138563 RepID=I0ELU9_HELC0|nr:nucleotide binding protein PINc [Helicobacter cetorum MIT 00-7128]
MLRDFHKFLIIMGVKIMGNEQQNKTFLSNVFGLYPIYELSIDLTYSIRREANAFELLLLALANDNKLTHYSLKAIANKLKIEIGFLKIALDNLIENGVIDGANIEEEIENLEHLKVKDLSLTSKGKESDFKEKSLNTKAQDKEFKGMVFDTLKREFVKKKPEINKDLENAVSKEKKTQIQELFANEFNEQDLHNFFEKGMKKKKNDEEWYEPNLTALTDVGHKITKTFYQNVPMDLSMDNNLSLNLEVKNNEEFKIWLEKTNKERLFECFIQDCLLPTSSMLEENENIEYKDLDKENLLGICLTTQDLPKNLFKEQDLILSIKFNENIKVSPKALVLDFSSNIKEPKLDVKNKTLKLSSEDKRKTQALYFTQNKDKQEAFASLIEYAYCYYNNQKRKATFKVFKKFNKDLHYTLDALFKGITFNTDMLSFLFGFYKEEEWLEKVSLMKLEEAEKLASNIKELFKKEISHKNMLNKLPSIENLEDLKAIKEIFPKISLALQDLPQNTQQKIFEDLFFSKNECLDLDTELSELISAFNKIKNIQTQKILFKDVSKESLNKVESFIKSYEKYVREHPHLASPKLIEKKNALLNFKLEVERLFAKNEERKIAILDTSFLMGADEKRVQKLCSEYEVILPYVVINELDGLKENKDKETMARSAIEIIHKLRLTERAQEVRDEILALLDKPNNDDKILCTALYYKLNSVTLFTSDKNLKNKASSFNLHTMYQEPKSSKKNKFNQGDKQ